MRFTHLLTFSILLACDVSSAAYAVNPNDMPWDEIDRVLKQPSTQADSGSAQSNTRDDGANPDATSNAKDHGPAPDLERLATDPSTQSSGSTTLDRPSAAEAPLPALAPQTAVPAKPSSTPASVAPAETKPSATTAAASDSAAPKIVANSDIVYLPAARYLDANAKKALAGVNEGDRQTLGQFYGSRMGATLWVSRNGYNDDARNLMAALADADNWGMKPADYKVPDLKTGTDGTYAFDDLTIAEVRLSLAAMAYARDARGDRITSPPSQLGTYIDRTPQILDRRTFLETLTAAPDKGAYLKSLQPKQPQFEALRKKLLSLRAAAEQAEQLKIPDGPKLMPGKSHPQIALLRKVLKIPAPTAKPDGTPADDTFYDDALAKAVVAYKDSKGLSPATPAITTALRRSLNSSNDISESKIIANMEEWRWMPEDLGKFYVTVNIPEFLVRVVQNGEVIHEERIVSGRVDTETPIFSDLMRTIVFQPRWNVPDSIKIKELLPSLRAGGDPLARQGLVMERNGRRLDPYNIDWTRTDIRYFSVYQPPGGSNALGMVKFLFPNKHSVYLHDTPSKSLFNEPVRTFSHGCMRVRNPARLAEILLQKDKGWDKSIVDDLIANGPEENEVALAQPIPVHVTYFTASVANDGAFQSFPDVYGHERRIALALQGRWNEISKADERVVSPDDYAVADSADDWFGFGDNRQGRDDEYTDERGRRHKKQGGIGNFFKQVFGGY